MSVKIKRKTQQQQKWTIGAIVGVAVAIAAAVIFVSNSGFNPNNIQIDYTQIHQERTDDGGFILGDPAAPVTLIAFEDFLCPHCQDYELTLRRFIQDYVIPGKARFEYRFMPAIDPQASVYVAQLVECSEILKPGSFWEAHNVMFELLSASRYSAETSRTFAERAGLNYAQLLDCQPSAKQVQTDHTLGNSLGVSGTPTIYVRYGDGDPIKVPSPPSYDQFASLMIPQQD